LLAHSVIRRRFVAFHSGAPLLYPGDKDANNGVDDLFVHDRATSTTLLVNRLPNGSPSVAPNLSAGSISANGRWVTYTSSGRDAPGDHDSLEDVFLQRLPALTSQPELVGAPSSPRR
jgi:Tol biopolymer transport system component